MKGAVIDLSRADGNVQVSQKILRKSALNPVELAKLPHDTLIQDVKHDLARLYECAENNIVLGNGSDEIIENIARMLGGSVSLTLVPTFERLFEVNEKFGYDSHTFALDSANSFLYTDSTHQSFLETIDRINPDIVWLCSPGNPTGTIISTNYIKDLIDRGQNSVFVVDQAFADIVQRGTDLSVTNLVQSHKNLIVLNSFSKSWGLAGARIGYAVTHESMTGKLSRQSVMFNVNSYALTLARNCINSMSYRQKEFKRIESSMSFVRENMENLTQYDFIANSDTGLFVLRHNVSENLDKMLLKQKIKVKRLHNFPGLEMNGFFRIQTPRNRKDLKKLIQALRAIT